MTGERIVLKVTNKINAKLKFLYRKNRSPELRRMLCNALIPAHFDCACLAWYPNLTKKRKKKQKKNKLGKREILSQIFGPVVFKGKTLCKDC